MPGKPRASTSQGTIGRQERLGHKEHKGYKGRSRITGTGMPRPQRIPGMPRTRDARDTRDTRNT